MWNTKPVGLDDKRRNPTWLRMGNGGRGNRAGGNKARTNHIQAQVKEREIARRILCGESGKEIATDLGISRPSLSNIMKRGDIRAKVMELLNRKDDIVIEIEKKKLESRLKAWAIIEEKLEQDMVAEDLSTTCAFDVLKVAEPKQVNMNVQQAVFSLNDIMKAKEEANKLREKVNEKTV